jgi:hypothetical protein
MSFSLAVVRGGALKALSALGAALEARGARVALDGKSFSLTACMVVPSSTGERDALNAAAGRRQHKRLKVADAEPAASSHGLSGHPTRDSEPDMYQLKARLFQESAHRVSLTASIANSEPEVVMRHFTRMFTAVREEVIQAYRDSTESHIEMFMKL